MIQMLTTKDDRVFAYGLIETITNSDNDDNKEEIRIIGYKVYVDDEFYIVEDIDNYNFYELESIPEDVVAWDYGYTEEKGFYEDKMIPYEFPKSETEILKEQLEAQEQILAEQDELLAMLLLVE